MTRQMPDACTPGNIPEGYDLVAYYVDGACAGPPVKGTTHVGISALATNAGTVGDCEPGNARPAVWVGWVQRRRQAGADPTIYCADDSLASFFDGYHWTDVRAAFQAAGVPEPHYWITKPGATSIPAGAVAVQNQLGVDGDRYDLSLVADYWPGVDPAEEDMTDEEHAWLQDIHTGMGTLVSAGGPALIYAIQASVAAVKAELDAIEGQVSSGQPPDLTGLKTELDALSKHVGVGTA